MAQSIGKQIMATATATPHSGVLLQKSIVKLRPHIHPKKFYKHNVTMNGNRFKYSYNVQLSDRLNDSKRIVYARCTNVDKIEEDSAGREAQREEKDVEGPGVEAALALLTFYRREISPLLPSSCRYVPSCSEYSMQAYKRYGVLKGTVLTAWRLCRCNPLGGSGFDPPRWFDENKPPST